MVRSNKANSLLLFRSNKANNLLLFRSNKANNFTIGQIQQSKQFTIVQIQHRKQFNYCSDPTKQTIYLMFRPNKANRKSHWNKGLWPRDTEWGWNYFNIKTIGTLQLRSKLWCHQLCGNLSRFGSKGAFLLKVLDGILVLEFYWRFS